MYVTIFTIIVYRYNYLCIWIVLKDTILRLRFL